MIEVSATARSPLGMSPHDFLRDVWQQRPLLIRRAFADFESPLSPDDLGGLACEDFALSRIVIHDADGDRWSVRTGPFEESDFAGLPPSHWTLLVQDVDKWDADVAALLKPFDFLPSWRVDDVMVSYAEDGGSVGAHVDQYDVFLLQGQGRRRWQISTDRAASTAFRDDVELRLLREFVPTHEWLLEPGDMLYLPPGIPHHGVAEGECLTFSIGMRAPAVAEMIADFAGFVAERLGESVRYADPGIEPAKKAGEIDDKALEKIESTLRDSLAVDASLLRGWFGAFITRYRAAHEAVPPTKALSTAEFTRRFKAGASLQANPWSRFAWSKARSGATLYVAGESFHCARTLAERLCQREPLDAAELGNLEPPTLDLLLNLLNAGHLALVRKRSKR
ncbi:cupin domain-containing protein [Dokdonella immobilis]|uniref:50S ribosomal protein L16 3-hydroxylase n=1 Tax=Dokdonella immobilis TaxID=578942 RepID=A0A1I4WN53_9GAMM|nr:cupin domain-containing protein [Dokdonella immobilis]SFN14616.1 50S ribosomal protein L16 3-hydroxylase [Dokdonella immobilis]